MNIRIFAAFVILGALLYSCSDDADANNKLANEAIQNKIVEEPVDTIPQANIEKLYKLSANEIFAEGSFKPENLEQFLPTAIDGFKTLPHSKGVTNDGYRLVISVSGQFVNEAKTILTIAIIDNGSAGIGKERTIYETPAADQGIAPQKLKDNNYTGFMIWNNAKNEGYLHVLVDDRFVIKIDGYNFQKDTKPLTDYLKEIKIQSLVDIAKKQ